MRNYFDCRVLYCSLSIGEGWGEVCYEDAQTLNQSINATLQPEINQQQYNAVILNRFIRALNH